jgi:hypothetical protein
MRIEKMIPTLASLKYEPGMAVADGDLVTPASRLAGGVLESGSHSP